MFFVIDAQLPPALTKIFVEAGHRAAHVNRLGFGDATDLQIFAFARRKRAVIVTKDADFVGLAEGQSAVAVVWVRIGNTTNLALRSSFARYLNDIVVALEAGDRIVIIE